jgi:hypothetical protein
VGYAPSPTTQILPRALELLREKNPKIQLHLHDISTAEMLLLLREKKLHADLETPAPHFGQTAWNRSGRSL